MTGDTLSYVRTALGGEGFSAPSKPVSNRERVGQLMRVSVGM